MQTKTISVRRSDLRKLLDAITVNPTAIFSVVCPRRTDLLLAYTPVGQFQTGHGAYVGDRSDVMTREFIRDTKKGPRRFDEFEVCCPNEVNDKGERVRAKAYGTEKVVLEPAGTTRRMICKRKLDNAPTKHWQPKPDGELRFDPEERGLYHVAGMYNDGLNNGRTSRYGQWRAWCFIDLETAQTIKNKGVIYNVEDEETAPAVEEIVGIEVSETGHVLTNA